MSADRAADESTGGSLAGRSRAWWGRLAAGGVGTVSLLAALVVATGLGGTGVTGAVTAAVPPSRGLLVVAGLLVGAGAVAGLVRGRRAAGRRPPGLPAPPERTVDEDTIVGAAFDRSLAKGIDTAPDASWWRGVGVREEVRSLAVDVLRTDGGYELSEVAEALETGRWTDDPRAATFLGRGSHLPVWTRVRDWFSGEGRPRQVEATLRELAAVGDVDLPRGAGGGRAAGNGGDAGGGSDAGNGGDAADTDRVGQADGDGAAGERVHTRGVSDPPDETDVARVRSGAGATAETATARSGHWRAGVLLALVGVSAGVLAGNTAIFLAAVVGLSYSAFVALAAAPEPTLFVERTVTPASPRPGDTLDVTVTVENVGSTVVPDLRVADQPPTGLGVRAGETHAGATLAPGETLTLEYGLEARRGTHRFGDVRTVSRATSGGASRRSAHAARTDITCYAPFDALELAPQTGPGAGRVETDTGGQGVEFYATRRYHPTDAMRRIDWKRYAATGELATVTYRESRAATVVFVVDGRHRVRRRAGEPDAVELGGYATVRVADALLAAQNAVGAVVFGYGGRTGRQLTVAGTLDPGRGREQSIRLRRLLRDALDVAVDDVADRSTGADRGTPPVGRDDADRDDTGPDDADPDDADRDDADPDAADATATPGDAGQSTGRATTDGGRATDWLRDHVPAGAQVVFVTPLLDAVATNAVTQLEAHGHALTVVSPAVTSPETPGGVFTHLERARRLHDLRGDDRVRVVDWSLGESLQAAVSRDSAGWDR